MAEAEFGGELDLATMLEDLESIHRRMRDLNTRLAELRDEEIESLRATAQQIKEQVQKKGI